MQWVSQPRVVLTVHTQVAKAKALGQDPVQAKQRKLPPLFKVGVSLQNMDIVIQPPVNEVSSSGTL